MDTIDLDAILSSELNKIEAYKNKGLNVEQWKDKYPNFYGAAIRFARETIEQALVLASEKAELITTSNAPEHGYPRMMVNPKPNVNPEERYIIVHKQSILDVEKLIK